MLHRSSTNSAYLRRAQRNHDRAQTVEVAGRTIPHRNGYYYQQHYMINDLIHLFGKMRKNVRAKLNVASIILGQMERFKVGFFTVKRALGLFADAGLVLIHQGIIYHPQATTSDEGEVP